MAQVRNINQRGTALTWRHRVSSAPSFVRPFIARYLHVLRVRLEAARK